jgi:hypothetical protein
MRTETIEIFQYDELSDEAKEKAVAAFSDINVDHDWWDHLYEDAETIGLKLEGFSIYVKCEGKLAQNAQEVAALILEHHGETCETHKDATQFLADLDKARNKDQSGWDVHNPNDDDDADDFEDADEYEELAAEFLKTLLGDYLTILNNEYEYLTGKDAIVETIQANEYEFLACGKQYF